MTDPVKPRRKVTGLISTAQALPSPATSTAPRVRAKVDPTSIATPSASPSVRPALRTTPSTASIRSHVTAPITRARSPAPSPSVHRTPHAHVTAGSRTPTHPAPSPAGPSRSTPTTKTASTPVARVRAAKTVVGTPGSTVTPGNRRVEETAEAAVRARTRALSLRSTHVDHVPTAPNRSATTPASPMPSAPITPVPPTRGHPHLLSPPLANDHPNPASPLSPYWRPHASPEIIDDYSAAGPSSNRSSPTRAPHIPLNTYAQHALADIIPHAVASASAPSSPVHNAQPFPREPPRSVSRDAPRQRPRLPYNPHSNNPPPLPPPPQSPELKSVALPSVTPAYTSRESSRAGSSPRKLSGSVSGSESGGVVVDLGLREEHFDRGRLSGTTAVDDVEQTTEDKDGDLDEVLGEDEEDAKVNRKVADLEISNASLMAINRTLEATKAKQRTEIIKLRRMLRESIGGANQSFLPISTSSRSLASPLGLFSPFMEDEHADGYMDEEMADEQLEARWDKLTDLVGAMRRRGELAVERGLEEVKVGPQRVLGWHEMEERGTEEIEDQSVELGTPPQD